MPGGPASVVQLPTGLIRLLRYFSWQPQVEADYSRGIIRDIPRTGIPAGGVYDAVDYLADQPGKARKRGGTAYQSGTLGDATGGVNMVAAPELPTGTIVVGTGADGHLYDCTDPDTSIDLGAFGVSTLDIPKLYVDRLIVTSSDGVTAPSKVYVNSGATTFATLGGSPPPGRLVATHLSRIILGSSQANPNRIWFSPVPDVESAWDSSNAYIDTNHSLTAIAPIQGVLCCFSSGATERVVGSTPPGTVGENMSLQPIGQIGCADARSIAPWSSYLVFASQEGVYVTNGAGFDSLTEKSDGTGILSYWRQQYETVAENGGFIAGGIVNRNYYVLTLGYDSTIVDTLVCYLPRKAWTRTSNLGCVMYGQQTAGSDELYGATMATHPGNRIVRLSGLLTPDDGNKADADGTPVMPVVEYRMIGTGTGLKTYGDGHLTYDMRDAATDNPTLSVQIATGIEAESGYAAVPESPLLESGAQAVRKRFTTSKDAQALHVKVSQSGASSKTELYLLEVDQRAFDNASEVAP